MATQQQQQKRPQQQQRAPKYTPRDALLEVGQIIRELQQERTHHFAKLSSARGTNGEAPLRAKMEGLSRRVEILSQLVSGKLSLHGAPTPAAPAAAASAPTTTTSAPTTTTSAPTTTTTSAPDTCERHMPLSFQDGAAGTAAAVAMPELPEGGSPLEAGLRGAAEAPRLEQLTGPRVELPPDAPPHYSSATVRPPESAPLPLEGGAAAPAHPPPADGSACGAYDGGDTFGVYLNGDPCVRCHRPRLEHSPQARAAWDAANPSVTPAASDGKKKKKGGKSQAAPPASTTAAPLHCTGCGQAGADGLVEAGQRHTVGEGEEQRTCGEFRRGSVDGR